jgi:hypothetical protein
MNYMFEFVYATKFVLQIYNANSYAEPNLLYEWLWLKSYVQIHVHSDWLYMLFMHQACVYKTKQQYVKSNEILTAVTKEAHLNCHINDILKDAIQAFQVKMVVKQEYLAYYVWKHIHN